MANGKPLTIEELRDYIEQLPITGQDLPLFFGEQGEGKVHAVLGAMFCQGPNGENCLMLSPMPLNYVGGI